MKNLTAALLLLAFASCSSTSNIPAPQKQLFQYGVIEGLLAGAMDGNLTIGELKKHGNFGIGTFNSADGELVAMDDAVYRVRYNGDILKVNDRDSTPFAVMTQFSADTSIVYDGVSYTELQQRLKSALNNNSIYAIRITGEFDSIVARAVAPGVKPYPTLKQLIDSSQRLFHYAAVRATAIGFISPDYLSRVNVPGYHMHFLNEEKTKGGHLFAFDARHVTVSLMELESVFVQNNRNASFMQLNQRKDRSEELKKIE
jgi:acetolactate decarboxylase